MRGPAGPGDEGRAGRKRRPNAKAGPSSKDPEPHAKSQHALDFQRYLRSKMPVDKRSAVEKKRERSVRDRERRRDMEYARKIFAVKDKDSRARSELAARVDASRAKRRAKLFAEFRLRMAALEDRKLRAARVDQAIAAREKERSLKLIAKIKRDHHVRQAKRTLAAKIEGKRSIKETLEAERIRSKDAEERREAVHRAKEDRPWTVSNRRWKDLDPVISTQTYVARLMEEKMARKAREKELAEMRLTASAAWAKDKQRRAALALELKARHAVLEARRRDAQKLRDAERDAQKAEENAQRARTAELLRLRAEQDAQRAALVQAKRDKAIQIREEVQALEEVERHRLFRERTRVPLPERPPLTPEEIKRRAEADDNRRRNIARIERERTQKERRIQLAQRQKIEQQKRKNVNVS